MRIVLVNPPKSNVGRAELTPPLGLLRLATVARRCGATPVICDLNLLWHLDPGLQESFYDACADRLMEADGDMYGFTSMCVDSHVALELARRIKQRSPRSIIVLGGTHFSAIAEDVLNIYPWVDYVVCGVGEEVFAALIARCQHGERQRRVLRSPRELVALAGSASAARPPEPAFDLVDLDIYFAANPRRMVDFESARGCRFKCAFCYSPGHYGQFHDFATDGVLAELSQLKSLGVARFFLTDDNFLNDPERAFQLCAAISESRCGLQWGCYATFPQINEPIVKAMQDAGCDRVFCGIDAVGKNSQQAFRKAFLPRRERFESKLHLLRNYGIQPTCAFLLCPPSHAGGQDFDATVETAIAAKLSGALIRLNTITLYNQTPSAAAFHGKFAPDNLKPQLLFDLPPPVERNHFARAHAELYPFHARFVPEDEWHDFVTVVHCLSTLIDTYPRTLESLQRDQGVSAAAVARRVLYSVGDLLRLPRGERREEEQVHGFDALKALATHPSVVRAIEAETPFEGVYDRVPIDLEGV